MLFEHQQNFVGFLRLAAFAQQRINRSLDRCDARIKPEHDALLVLDHVFVVRIEHEDQHRAIDPERRLDDPWTVARLRFLIEVS